MGVGGWGFTHFQVVNYLIFREKVPEFSPQSLQGSALFEGKQTLVRERNVKIYKIVAFNTVTGG
ncbi:MAG: hypothetical protein EWV90_01380 [Microcystis aeruginosa Ma_QC_Ch_20071001_M135]|nr:MAG: hypothetical protein EWV90_01380 [Microcystis aeruginosa Ma_QC_Ch_20071001_M135]